MYSPFLARGICVQSGGRTFRGDLGTNEGMKFISQDIGDPGSERVQTVCVGQFCQDHSIDYVDLLRLDIQGQEHSALKGAKHAHGRSCRDHFTELSWAKSPGAN